MPLFGLFDSKSTRAKKQDASRAEFSRRLMQDPAIRKKVQECLERNAWRRAHCASAIMSARSLSDFFTERTPQGLCNFIEERDSKLFWKEKVASQGLEAVKRSLLKDAPSGWNDCDVMGYRSYASPAIHRQFKKMMR